MIHSIVAWILLAANPFVLVVSKRKRKPVKKRARRQPPSARTRVKRARLKKLARPSRRPTRRPSRGKKVAVRARGLAPIPATPTATSKPVEPELLLKPVPPIGRAILLSPENEKFVDSFHPTFRWLSVGGATRYEIAWGEDPALNTSHTIFSIATEATVPGENPLRLGETYYWRVRGGNESGWGPWSVIASFRVLQETA